MPDERLLLCGGNMSVCAIAMGEENIKQFLELIKKPEIKAVLNLIVENILATSELNVLKRIAALEDKLGLNGFSDEDEDHELTIQEQLSLLAERIDDIESNPITYPVDKELQSSDTRELKPTTITEVRAGLLVSHLKDTGNDHLNSHEIIHFLKCKLPDNCKLNENIQNIRKVKQDVLKAAASMYTNVFLNKKRTGRHEVRLVLATDTLYPSS